MSVPTPTITLDVDLTNPGQFLACCGLFELASRLAPEALAWFDERLFNLTCCNGDLLDKLNTCEIRRVGSAKTPLLKENGKPQESPPVQLGSPFNLFLDWWEDDDAVHCGFKTWAGGQTVLGFIDGMRGHVKRMGALSQDFLSRDPIAVEKPKPFYFDCRISRLTSLDLGFSAEKFSTAFSPAVELLALVGLQRFRPATVIPRERYAFATWTDPLPVSIAAAVHSGLIPTLIDRRYAFPLVVRTGGKYKAFGPATLERSVDDRFAQQV